MPLHIQNTSQQITQSIRSMALFALSIYATGFIFLILNSISPLILQLFVFVIAGVMIHKKLFVYLHEKIDHF